jgi:hypothetical protein
LARAFVLDRLLRYVFIFLVGLMGLWAALGHIVFPARVAQAIGWPTSPFQFEVGVAKSGDRLGWVIRGVPLVRSAARDQFGAGVFLIGAGVGHLRDIVTAGNFAPGNAGPILFTDLLTPTAVFLLL